MNLDKILVLPGDGIGPSTIGSALAVMNASTDSLEILQGAIGRTAYETTGQYLPHETLDLLDECPVILCGPVIPPESGTDPLITLRKQLDLYARVGYFTNLSPDLGVDGMKAILWGANNNVQEEITEVPDFDGITLNKYIKKHSYNRVMTLGLSELERKRIKKVTCLTREDFFPISSGMFSETFDSLFPEEDYEVRHMNVKDWTAHAVKDPAKEDCIFCVDLYSQVISGILGSLTGYNHMSPICYIGDEYRMYSPNHKAVMPDVEEGYANPTSAIVSASLIMEEAGLKEESDAVIRALKGAYQSGERTPDTGGSLTTKEFTECVIKRI